jgi:hypothetical protein
VAAKTKTKKRTKRTTKKRNYPDLPGRYTTPLPKSLKQSPKWVAIVALGIMIIGVLMMVLNFMNTLLPGAFSYWYLLGGLVALMIGFLMLTNYK